MSISSEISRIKAAVSAAYTSAAELGATMPTKQNVASLAATVASAKAVLFGSAQSLTTAQKTQARTNIDAEQKRLEFANKSVAVSAWASSTTYPNWPFRAAIALSGVTAAMTPEVIFAPDDATSGNLAPVCAPYAGGVYIYAVNKPTAAMTIPTIIVRR